MDLSSWYYAVIYIMFFLFCMWIKYILFKKSLLRETVEASYVFLKNTKLELSLMQNFLF